MKTNICHKEEIIYLEEVFLEKENEAFKGKTKIPRIYSHIFTDGIIVKEETSDPIDIDRYLLNGKPYQEEINTLIKRKIYISNATYIVKVTYASNFLNTRLTYGMFDLIEESKIYIDNPQNKTALKKIKETLSLAYTKSRDYYSLRRLSLDPERYSRYVKYSKERPNIYILIKKID